MHKIVFEEAYDGKVFVTSTLTEDSSTPHAVDWDKGVSDLVRYVGELGRTQGTVIEPEGSE